MRRDHIAKERQPFLVPALGYPNACALVAPPTPRMLPSGSSRHDAGFPKAHAALGRLQGTLKHLANTDMVTRTLARREAVMSSQIEGTKSDLQQLLTYEATHIAGGLPADVRITERYVAALRHGLERVRVGGRAALDLALIHQLHALLMEDEAAHFPVGAYRETQVWIGPTLRIEDATFVPAPPARVKGCMDEMAASILKYAPREDEQTVLTILAQLAIAHAQFETIHPYHDGNGRTGRLLMPLILAAEGYPPLYLSGALLRAKSQYYVALASVQLQGEWGPWLDLLGHAVIESCDESISIAEDLLALAERWEQELRSYRAHSATRRLPRFLIGYPVLSVQQAAAGLNISVPAANAALNNLLAAGIVSLVNERQWGRVFQATEVLRRLDQPPGMRGM
ncbi:MAG TPA: Fic/DOC family N-terminal domain-containing protein [Steroidobacteraceae bacterium]|nr:Fic/DOC family N-terminal domain-containing protein [Steroidobacteraceae bacterium]